MNKNNASESTQGNDPPRDVDSVGHNWREAAEDHVERVAYTPHGQPGVNRWQTATISKPGLDDRGTIFFAAVEMTRMPMILTDPTLPDNPIVFANRAFFDLTGYQQDEIVGRNCRFLQGAQTDRETVTELREAIADERAVSVELLNYKRDGTPFWNAVFVAPVHSEDGEVLYFFASQLDITRRRASEQALRQAQKMESIGQLTAGLAHDFNNLLQVVLGNLEFLDAKIMHDDLRRHVDKARDAAERGTRLTKQLLAFARKTRLEPRILDVSAVINGFGELLESTVGSQVDLQMNLRRRLPPILVDPVHLEMALLNVTINARDAMASGGMVTITTSLAYPKGSEMSSDRYVAIAVTDEGAGMPSHVLERATEPFFTTKDVGKGTGLGLAMVHGFVSQSLGRLEIESEVGRGTTVRMLFPVRSKTDDPSLEEVARDAKPSKDARGSLAETILIVEDNEDVLTLAQEHLTMLGYRVLIAHNADEALRLLERPENSDIDLLFTDILMPGGMNGIVLAEKVSTRVPDVAVLFTTGYNEEMIPERSRPIGADVLGKPYRRSELADRVRAALNQKARRAAAPKAPLRGYDGPAHEG